jgi:LysM repeat protein
MTYIVKPGDTLNSIANQYGVSPQSLLQANGLTNPSSIYAGQSIRIPIPIPPFPGPTPPLFPGPGPGREIEQRVARLEQRSAAQHNEINRLSQQVNRLENEADRLRERVIRLEQRVDRLQEQPR